MSSHQEISLVVDKNLEKVYTRLLRKALEHPEEWKIFDHWKDDYCSPTINDHGVFFVTVGKSYNFEGSFYVYKQHPNGNHTKVHQINISFWDFKTPKMLRTLHYFMPHKKEWEEAQNTTKTLKELLGIEFDRYAKIMKIKKKI
jgi:hypothetical protein